VGCEEYHFAEGGVIRDGIAMDISLLECEQACKNTNTCQEFGHAISDTQPWGKGMCALYESCDSYSDWSNQGDVRTILREKKPECTVGRSFTSGSTLTGRETFDCPTSGAASIADVRSVSVPIDPRESFSLSFHAQITDMTEDVSHYGSIIQISDSANEICFRMTTNQFRQSTCDDGEPHYWYLMKRSSGSFSVFCDGVEQSALSTVNTDCETGPLNVVIGAHTNGDMSGGWCRIKGTFSDMVIESWTDKVCNQIACHLAADQEECLSGQEMRQNWEGDHCVWVGSENTGAGHPGAPCQPKSWVDNNFPTLSYTVATCTV